MNDLAEVRCCCDPGKLLGYLPPPAPGRTRQYFVSRNDDQPECVVLDYCVFWSWYFDEEGGMKHITAHAWKSNDHPIEILRRITGWIDADVRDLVAPINTPNRFVEIR